MLAAMRRAASRAATALKAEQQLRQLRDIRRDPSRLVFAEQLSRRSPPRLILEIDIGERLSVVVAHDEVGVQFIDEPGRWEAAGCICCGAAGPARVAGHFLA